MKQYWLIFFLFVAVKLNSQWLFDLRRTFTGSVISVVQEVPVVTLPDQTFKLHYPQLSCRDSILIVRNDQYSDTPSRECAKDFDFSNSYYPKINVISFDPFADNDIGFNKQEGIWEFIGKNTWRYIYRHKDQTWEFDEKGRLKKISDWFNNDTIIFALEYFYGPNSNLNRITKTHYNLNNPTYIFHNQWFDDEKGRIWMRIDYNGKFRDYTKGQLADISSIVDANLTKSKQAVSLSLDTLAIQLGVVYKYGRYGLEIANGCFAGERYCYTDRLSDSIFYDNKGRISRFISYFTPYCSPNCIQKDFIFGYNERTDQLERVLEHRYHRQPYAFWGDYKTLLSFTYGSNRRIVYANELLSTVRRAYIDGEYGESEENVIEENKFTYTYKH